jgi:hypothetical protein
MKMNPLALFCAILPLIVGATLASAASGEPASTNGKTFIDYFEPTPIVGVLSKDVWGAAEVGPRDPKNGLEDPTMKQWDYWDGRIIKGPDGRYNLYGSRWSQAVGHHGWGNSKAVHAVSDHLFGPYIDKGLCWPDNEGGKGHNVTALFLPDGRYAIVVSETRPGDVFVSHSPDGPWTHQHRDHRAIRRDLDQQKRDLGALHRPRTQHLPGYRRPGPAQSRGSGDVVQRRTLSCRGQQLERPPGFSSHVR